MTDTICPDCGKDLGRWVGFIHMNNGDWCGEGTADAVAGFIWGVFGINLSRANIDRMAEEMRNRLSESLAKVLGEI